MPVDEGQIAAIADADARANYRILLDFRARLLVAPTLEACYLACTPAAMSACRRCSSTSWRRSS